MIKRQTSVLLLLLAIMPAYLAASDLPGDWSMFGNGPSHTGYQPGVMGDQAPFLVWRKVINKSVETLNPVVIANDRVYVTPANNHTNSSSYVLALDMSSGDEVWAHHFEETFSMDPPAFADGNVYVQRANSESAYLDSFNAASGSLNWSTAIEGNWQRAHAPTIAQGKLWINGGADGGMYGFEQSSGKILFHHDLYNHNSGWTPLFHQGYVYSWTTNLFGKHDPATGEVLAAGTLGLYPGNTEGVVAVADRGVAYLQGGGYLVAVNLNSFSPVWGTPDLQIGTPAIAGNNVYTLDGNTVKRFDAGTGTLLGSFDAPAQLVELSQPLLTDDKLIVSSLRDNKTFIIDRHTMQLRRTISEGGHVSLANNKLFIVNDETISAWHVAYRSRTNDQSPAFNNLPASVTLPYGMDEIALDIADLVSDPDDANTSIYLSIESNSHQALVSAKVIANRLKFSFADFPGEAELVLRANSFGKVITHKINIALTNPDIDFELFDSAGSAIKPGQTVSGTVTGKVTVTNRLMQHAQIYQNFRVLHTIEPGHMIDAEQWERTFSIDTSSFFDGENLISMHVHPHNVVGSEYLTSFDVEFFKLVTANNNPAPNGDKYLPIMNFNPAQIVLKNAMHVPGHTLELLRNAFEVNDDFGNIEIDVRSSASDKAQVIPHLGTSVLGRFRWVDRIPPFADSKNGIFEGIHLLNFQKQSSEKARLVFFFNDDAGRANYGFYPFELPALPLSDRQDYPLPALDAKILNVRQGDEIIIPNDDDFIIQVEVRNPQVLGNDFPQMSTWIGNRSVAITDLEPHIHSMGEGESSFTVEVKIPTSEIRKLQNARQGGPDSTAFAIWVDFTSGDSLNLPSSEHVHVSSLRTMDLDWPYGPPRVQIMTPVQDDSDIGDIEIELYVYGNLSGTGSLYVQIDNEDPVRIEEYSGQQGLFTAVLKGYPRKHYSLKAFFTDSSGVPLEGVVSSDQVTFDLINDPPVASIDAYILDQGGSISVGEEVGLLNNDLDLEGDYLTVSSMSAPEHGEVIWATDGTLTYTPEPGFFGTEKIYYTAFDGFENSKPAIVLFSVRPTEYVGVSGDWHTFGNGPAHSGYQPGFVDAQDPMQIWSKEIPSSEGIVNQVAVAENQVFLTPSAYHKHTYTLALDASSGKEIWRYDFDKAISVNSPTYSNGDVFIQKGDLGNSDLWSFDAYTGAINWVSPYFAQWRDFYAPTAAEGKVWIAAGSDWGMYGFDQANGEQFLSESALEDVYNWTPLYYDGRLFSWTGGKFAEHDKLTGKIIRSVLAGGVEAYSQDGVAIAGEQIAYIQDSNSLIAIDLSTFQFLWELPVSQRGTPALSDGLLYAVERNKILLIDANTGVLLKSQVMPSTIRPHTQPLLTDDSVIVSSNQEVYILDRISLQVQHVIAAGGLLSLADDKLFIAGSGELSAWLISDRVRIEDTAPMVKNPIQDLFLYQGAESVSVDLGEVFDDPDDPDAETRYLVALNSNNSLVTASIENSELKLRFAEFPGRSTIVVRANSAGKIADAEFNVVLTNPEIVIELFDSEGIPIGPFDTVSGVVSGKATISNHEGNHAQFYQNFRILNVHGQGHVIDSDPWVRNFSVDTSAFYDGENLISVHVHPHNQEGIPYLSTFDVGTVQLISANDNPAPNGDTELPAMRIDPEKIVLETSSQIPVPTIRALNRAIVIEDDFGEIDIDQDREESNQAQVITHLGASVLGRFRWTTLTPPFGDSNEGLFEGVHLLNFQQDTAQEARIVFFFNDAAGRANYGFHSFEIPEVSPEVRQSFPLPSLDAKILNIRQGDEIVIPVGGSFELQVEVSNPRGLGSVFPHMSTWIGNRSVATTDLLPYIAAMPEDATSVILSVEIPEVEIRKLQESRQGGQDSVAFAIWNDFTVGEIFNLPSSDHVHVSMIRTRDLNWPYGPPVVEFLSPAQGSTHAGGVEVALYVYGNLSQANQLFIQVNDEVPVKVESYAGVQGRITTEIPQPTRGDLSISAFFTDVLGDPLVGETAIAEVSVELRNDPPVAVIDSFQLPEGHSLSVSTESGLLANDSDLENDQLTVLSIDRLPEHGELNWSGDGSLTYTPQTGFVGTDTLYYSISDGWDSSSPGMATLTVLPARETGIQGDWPQFGNDSSHSGFQAGFVGNRLPELVWRKEFQSDFGWVTPVVVADDQVFAIQRFHSSTQWALALDTESGSENWRTAFAPSHSLNPPAYAEGKVYLQRGNHGDDTQLWALNSRTGTIDWSSPFSAQWSEYFAPTIANSRVWINGGYYGGLYGYDQYSGNELFRNLELTSVDKWTPLYHQGRLYSWTNPFFTEHDPETGDTLRQLKVSEWVNENRSAVAVAENGIAYLQDDYRLTAIRLHDFEILWQVEVTQRGTPAVSHGSVYFIAGQDVTRLDGLNGRLLSSFTAPDNLMLYSQPIVTNDTVFVASETQVFALDRFELTSLYKIEEGGLLTLADNKLFISRETGISAWKVAEQDPSLLAQSVPVARFDGNTGILHIPVIRFLGLDDSGIESTTYQVDAIMALATDCSDLTLRLVTSEPADANHRYFLQGEKSNAISYANVFDGEFVIPYLGIGGPEAPDIGFESAFKWVKLKPAAGCEGLAFSVSSALPVD